MFPRLAAALPARTLRPARTAPLALAALLVIAALSPSPPAAARGFDFDPGWATHRAAGADLDGDGALDLVLVQSYLDFGPQRGRMVVLLGDPADPGHWRSRTEVPCTANPRDLVVADIDGNGRPDAAIAGAFDGAASVLLQDLAGNFARADYAATVEAQGIAVGDLNRDGLPDLALVGRNDAVVLLQDAGTPGTFLPAAVVAAGVKATCVGIADMDGAAGGDVVLARDDDLLVLLQDAGTAGLFPAATSVDLPGHVVDRMALADIDGDGRVDAAFAMRGLPFGGPGRGLGVLLQDGAGPLQFLGDTIQGDQPFRTVEVMDMDGDGNLDLLGTGAAHVLWFRQDPGIPGTFKRMARKDITFSEGGVAGGDFDADGLPDVAIAFLRPYIVRQNPSKPGKFKTPKAFRESRP